MELAARRLLALSGKRFSGKDTFAALLKGRVPELAAYACADESKRLLVEVEARHGVAVDLARLTEDRAYKELWRTQLTQLTVDAIAADPHVFVRAVARRLEEDPRPALLTDLRLKLELDWLRPRFDLTVVRLLRSDAARASSGFRFDSVKDLHPTETELDDPALWDVTISNDGTLEELAGRAREVAERYLP